jgi:hypothetical protein
MEIAPRISIATIVIVTGVISDFNLREANSNTSQTKQSEAPTAGVKGQGGMTGRLTSPLLTFNLVAEIERLHQEQHWLKDGRISKTVVKHSDFIQNRSDLNAGRNADAGL